ncbi:MAG TPA: hypothetical protein VGL93_31805 [Streptosporangiaceae bacterium]|jgi:hypothetical protein
MRRLGAVVLVGVAVLFMTTGCDKTSSQCRNGSCEVAVSGRPTVNLGGGSGPTSSSGRHRYGSSHNGPSLTVQGYEGDAVRINVHADTQTVRTGQTAMIGGLRVRVESVSGESAKLHVDYRAGY